MFYTFPQNSIFSNSSPSSFVMKNVLFERAENAYTWCKARSFEADNADLLKSIAKAQTSAKAKKLGCTIQNIDDDEWDAIKYYYMLKVNREKYFQNEQLKEALLATGNKILVAASARDNTWCSGFAEDITKQIDHWGQFKGINALGLLLTEIREEIKTGVYRLIVLVDELKQSYNLPKNFRYLNNIIPEAEIYLVTPELQYFTATVQKYDGNKLILYPYDDYIRVTRNIHVAKELDYEMYKQLINTNRNIEPEGIRRFIRYSTSDYSKFMRYIYNINKSTKEQIISREGSIVKCNFLTENDALALQKSSKKMKIFVESDISDYEHLLVNHDIIYF